MAIGAGWAEGAFVDAGWVVGAWEQPSAIKTIGGTSQLEAFDSTGQINLGWQIGGTSQLEAFDSSGAIQAGDAVADDTVPGGWWIAYEQEQFRRRAEKAKRLKAKKQAEEIQNELDKALALAERELEEEAARVEELTRLTKLVAEFKDEIETSTNERIIYIAKQAIEQATYSRMEQLERELFRLREEESFILLATQILLNNQ